MNGIKILPRDILKDESFGRMLVKSTALRALASLKQGRKEEIPAYIRRFDLVCTQFLGTMLNVDTLKKFFIQ